MAAGNYSIGAGWPGDVLRRLLGVRGKWEPPGTLADKIAAVVEVRPQFEWEYFRAGWTRGAIHCPVAAVAGQFGTVAIENTPGSGRLVIVRPAILDGSGTVYGLYTNQLFGGVGGVSALLSGRWVQGNNLLVQLAARIGGGNAVALPAAGNRFWRGGTGMQSQPVAPVLELMPGQCVAWFAETANIAFAYTSEVLEIPLADLD